MAPQEIEPDECAPAMVIVDNYSDEKFSVISLSVLTFPGLLRIVTWVLIGLDLVVHRAKLRTDPVEGIANDEFYVTTQNGNKVNDPQGLADRIEEFVTYCIPDGTHNPTVFQQGPIKVDNESDEAYTVLTLFVNQCNPRAQDLLIDVSSTLTAVGVGIVEADIGDETAADASENPCATQEWEFRVCNQVGSKLDYVQVSSLMYILSQVVLNGDNQMQQIPTFLGMNN
eukprot:gene1172-1740_t